MVTESPIQMMPEMGVRPMMMAGGGEDLEKELGLLLREQRRQEASDRERELSIYRSGSAPPTVDGSLAAVGGIFGREAIGGMNEENIRSDPAYLSYYYKHVNLNPRLPPPVLSKEDWRFNQRLHGMGGIGDKRRVNWAEEQGGSSLFAQQPGFHKEGEGEMGTMVGAEEWLDMGGDGLIGLPGLTLGRQKSFADIFQDDMGHTTPVSGHLSRPTSRSAFGYGVEILGSDEPKIGSFDGPGPGIQNNGALAPQTFASVLGNSLSRSNTPDPQLVTRSPSPRLPPVGVKLGNTDKKTNGSGSVNIISSRMVESNDLVNALSGMSLLADEDYTKQHPFSNNSDQEFLNMPSIPHLAKSPYPELSRKTAVRPTISSPNSYPRAPSSLPITSPVGSPAHYPNTDGASAAFTSYGLGGYSGNMPPLFENAAAAALQMPLADQLYMQYLRAAEYAAQATANYGDPSMEMGYLGNSYSELLGIQKASLGALLQPQKQYGMGVNNGYYGNPAFGLGMSYPGNPLASPLLPGSPVGPGSPLRHGERSIRFPSGLRMGSWQSDPSGNLNDNFPSSLLEEFKSNKIKCYELSDIAGHVVEFSADQNGSRFIQQKLEMATNEEKNMVFEEIMPQAFSLITDVFGNYVIQKFFEHGSADQRRELADQLTGHVLTLSLQMYGCRVIQKAIEVVDLDQQTRMVAELDGQIMRCVRDQNGNHVIQKCIECVPQDAIQFIISSFYSQVVTLSTHPYGCRVIQRVLEHCDDPRTQQIMMDEIMGSVCKLAQDQYGNYVVQHVLEHGKPHERSAIIKKLAGLIVQMSQQKFASNVVEKCLTFGGPEERQVLVNEMLGSTEENEPLQAMMKDQFANYVVQKVLETCDEQQREHILARIKVHLSALKKYTYGKHIVARVEKLVAAGERRIGIQSSYAS